MLILSGPNMLPCPGPVRAFHPILNPKGKQKGLRKLIIEDFIQLLKGLHQFLVGRFNLPVHQNRTIIGSHQPIRIKPLIVVELDQIAELLQATTAVLQPIDHIGRNTQLLGNLGLSPIRATVPR